MPALSPLLYERPRPFCDCSFTERGGGGGGWGRRGEMEEDGCTATTKQRTDGRTFELPTDMND